MATLALSAKAPAAVKADVLVLAVASSPNGPRLLRGDVLPGALRRRLTSGLSALGVTGAVDSVHRLPGGDDVTAPVLALTGVGPVRGGTPTPETLRRAAGAATRALAGTVRVALALPADNSAAIAAIAEGALLGAYSFDRYRTAATTGRPAAVRAVTVLADSARTAEAKAAARRAEVVAAAIVAARDLVNTAPVDLFPETFAQAATTACAQLPITVTVLDERELAREGFGGLLAVGQGSARPPRLVRLDYRPDGASTHLALIGKGITFDSGGLSIKPAAGMETMKSDMSGAAAVLSTVVAAAQLAVPVRISAWLALAENMPSGAAQRPSDVITIRGGRTVEVLNTDAEGRLVLADAIVAAGETGPDLMVDVATLTGAQMVALGNRVSAIMSNNDELRTRLHRLADETGEQFWPMPLPPELRASMDSAVADIANLGERFGGMLVAGLFLAEFVPEVADQPGADQPGVDQPATDEAAGAGTPAAKIPWAHLDIAGPSFNTGSAYGYTPVGGTGVSVRTLLALAEEVAVTGG